jgi:hypothetical protein
MYTTSTKFVCLDVHNYWASAPHRIILSATLPWIDGLLIMLAVELIEILVNQYID